MANEDIKKKLVALGAQVKGRQLTATEDISIEVKLVRAITPKTRSDVRKLLAESINASEADVLVKLAASDDNNRILDDIVNELNKSKK